MPTPVLVGEEHGQLLFECPSFSDPREMYEIRICRKHGWVRCTCPDAQCRQKRCFLVDLLDNTPEALSCKHMRELVRVYRGLLG